MFFGSARFHSRSTRKRHLQLLEKPGSAQPAPPEEQERVRLAKAGVEMARYYEDARRLAHLLTDWTKKLPSASATVSSSPPAAARASWKPPTAARTRRAARPSG